jgi:dTDP-4-dehydrorhamnose reductase
MKIIILGSGGMMGSMLEYYCKSINHPYLSVNRNMFDVLKDPIHKLDDIIEKETCVVNCIGCIPQKKYKDEEYIKINKIFPLLLSEYCKNRDCKLIHLSTNCVFSGNAELYRITEPPDATDIYGISKAEGEPKDAIVIRSSIIGLERGSFGLLAWFLNSKDQVNGYTTHYWNGITTLELSKIIIELVSNGNLTNRLIHVCSEELLTKYNLLCIIKTIFKKDIIITPVDMKIKHYTLFPSDKTFMRKNISEQLKELKDIEESYFKSKL